VNVTVRLTEEDQLILTLDGISHSPYDGIFKTLFEDLGQLTKHYVEAITDRDRLSEIYLHQHLPTLLELEMKHQAHLKFAISQSKAASGLIKQILDDNLQDIGE